MSNPTYTKHALNRPVEENDSKSLRSAKRKFHKKWKNKHALRVRAAARNQFARNTGAELLRRRQQVNARIEGDGKWRNMAPRDWCKRNESEPLAQFNVYRMNTKPAAPLCPRRIRRDVARIENRAFVPNPYHRGALV